MILAWIFVISRVLQAYIHVTSNIVKWRGRFYIVGALVLMIMWIIYMIEIYTGGVL